MFGEDQVDSLEGREPEPRLRVVHVITKGRPMGGSQIDTYLAARHQRASCDVELIMGCDGPLLDAAHAVRIPGWVVPMRNRLLDPIGDARALAQLVRHFRRRRPDVVHTHTSKAGILGRAAARLAGVPVAVHTIHIPPFSQWQHPLRRRLLILLERAWSRLTDHYVAVADSLGEEFVRERICPGNRVMTIGSGVDFAAFRQLGDDVRETVRKGLAIDPEYCVIISVANLEPRKRYDVFLQAAANLLRVESKALFVIVGTGEMESALRSQIDLLGLEGRVLLLGRRDDVPALLSASDIFVQTSQLEGLSRSLIEAMYSQLPVVASDVNATWELVKEGVTGYLVPPGDPDTMADRLLCLLRHPALRRRMGLAAREAVSHAWSVEAMAAAHDALYHRLLREKSAV